MGPSCKDLGSEDNLMPLLMGQISHTEGRAHREEGKEKTWRYKGADSKVSEKSFSIAGLITRQGQLSED